MERLNWLLVGSYAADVVVDLAAPILLAVFLARRYQARWRYWWYGVLVFLLFQGVTRVPAMLLLQALPSFRQALEQPAFLWSFLFFAAFTAGLFEEGGRWLAFRYVVRPEDRRWRTALMLGAGHGGLECMAIGLVVVAALVGYLVIMLLPPETFAGFGEKIEAAKAQFTRLQGWEPLLGGWERLAALAIQVALSVMVLQAFLRGPRWWWYALAAHTAIDFTAVAIPQFLKTWHPIGTMLCVEAIVGVYAVLALWFIRFARPREAEASPPAFPPTEQVAG